MSVLDSYVVIYLQGVKGVSPAKSGTMILPAIFGLLFGCIIAGFGTSIVGYYIPFMLFTSIVAPIAAGLITTLRVDTKLITLLCYEGLIGFAIGIGIQGPQVAASAIFTSKDTPSAISVVQFGQGIGPAIFISVAQSIFTGRLTSDIGHYATGLNTTSIENMGLSDLKTHVGPKKLGEVLLGYDKAVSQTLYLPVALTSMSIVGTLAMEWRSVKKKQS